MPVHQTPAAPSQQTTQEDFLNHLADKIIENGSEMDWITNIIQRNAISIDGLIEADIFGSLSDFKENYPSASTLDKFEILKAYLENKTHYTNDNITYDIKNIVAPLIAWSEYHEEFDRTLDSAIVKEKMAKRVSWLVQLNPNTKPIYDALTELNILIYMEKNLVAENENAKAWINETKQKLYSEYNVIRFQSSVSMFLTGAYSLKRLLQREVASILSFINSTRSLISSFAQINSLRQAIKTTSLTFFTGIEPTIALGELALLPYRLLLTVLRESAALSSKLLHIALRKITPNNTPSLLLLNALTFGFEIVAISLATHYFQISTLFLLGLQIFPQSWNYTFIAQMVIGISAIELVAGVSYGLYNKITAWLRPDNSTSPQLEPEAGYNGSHNNSSTPTVAPDSVDNAINPEQRKKLIRLLMLEKNTVANSSTLRPDEKQEKSQELQEELTRLYNKSPYILSQFDKALIQGKQIDGFGLSATNDSEHEDDNRDTFKSNAI